MLSKLSIVGTSTVPSVRRGNLLKRVSSTCDMEAYELLCREDGIARHSPTPHLETKRKKVKNRELLSPVMKKPLIQQISPQKCNDYVSYFRSKDICDSNYYENNFELQSHRRPIKNLMEFQKGIDHDQRQSIIKWIFKVGHKLSLSSEHIIAGICLFERCLGRQQYKWREAHKASIVCLILSSKMDELRDKSDMNVYKLYINSMDTHGFTNEELISEETRVMSLLDYKLVQPNCATFLIMFLVELDVMDKNIYNLCSFINELFIADYISHRYLHSTIAETVVKIAMNSMDLDCKKDAFYHIFRPICPDTLECLYDIKTCVLTRDSKEKIAGQYADVQDISLKFDITL